IFLGRLLIPIRYKETAEMHNFVFPTMKTYYRYYHHYYRTTDTRYAVNLFRDLFNGNIWGRNRRLPASCRRAPKAFVGCKGAQRAAKKFLEVLARVGATTGQAGTRGPES